MHLVVKYCVDACVLSKIKTLLFYFERSVILLLYVSYFMLEQIIFIVYRAGHTDSLILILVTVLLAKTWKSGEITQQR